MIQKTSELFVLLPTLDICDVNINFLINYEIYE